MFWTAFGLAADDGTDIVESAIKDEIAEFDAVEDRWEKSKLKPAEKTALFGKKTLNKEQQRERLAELRKRVESGEVSFRLLSLNFEDVKVGTSGVIAPKWQPLTCTSVVDSDIANEFEAGYSFTDGAKIRTSRPLVFVNIPASESLIPNKRITITVPVIVTGRRNETFVFESFAAAVKRVREFKSRQRN
jgi:hypothetical protein